MAACVQECQGLARQDKAGVFRLIEASHGWDGLVGWGMAGEVRQLLARSGLSRLGRLGLFSPGKDRQGSV